MADPRTTSTIGATWRFGTESGLVVGATGLVVLLVTSPWGERWEYDVGAHQLLTLVTAAVGAAAAMTADLAARLHRMPGVAWIGAGFALYSLVVLPSTTIDAAAPAGTAALSSARLVLYLGVMVILLVAVRPWPTMSPWGGWAVAGAAAVLAFVLGELVYLGFDGVLTLALSTVVTVVAVGGWAWCAVVYLAGGLRLARPPLWRLGLGVGVLAVAQTWRAFTGGAPSEPNLPFAALRLLGLAVVLVAAVMFYRWVLGEAHARQAVQQEQLRLVALSLERAGDQAADRAHELRSGLNGLAGAVGLLGGPRVGDPEQARLRAAVLAELRRLQDLVDEPGRGSGDGYQVGGVLRELTELRTAAGMDVTLRVHGDPEVVGSADTLRQVLTALLDNCRRHAPGARVRIEARAKGMLVLIEVCDDGPGLTPGSESRVLERGVHDERGGGSGLGLHIARELLAEEQATLHVMAPDPARPGFAAVLGLPAAAMYPVAPFVPERSAADGNGAHR